MKATITFGPVPSRRLGRSLGINNIPPKSCSYSCVYCQLGPTHQEEIAPRVFYPPEQICQAVVGRVAKAQQLDEPIDYLTFVPDGEPTLDANLGETIDLLRGLAIPIAVISNASLLWREEVRAAMSKADWVSLKVDSLDEAVWRRVNQPHPELDFDVVRQGIREFAKQYSGELTTETMLVRGINDAAEQVAAVGGFLAEIAPARAYLAIPIRPPAVGGVEPPNEAALTAAYAMLSAGVEQVEYLIGYEGDAFASTGDAADDLLSITAVHPMREDAVYALLRKARADPKILDALVADGALKVVSYAGKRFYLRPITER